MSKIVLGLATSHSPLLTFDADVWLERAKDDRQMRRLAMSDGRTLSYAELAAETQNRFEAQSSIDHLAKQSAQAQRQLDRLADELAAAAPDVVIIVGDDQEELYTPGNTPAVSIYYGDEMVMHPRTLVHDDLPEWRKIASVAYRLDAPHRYRAAPDYAYGLVERMIDQGVDLAVASEVPDPMKAGFGHAYGFIVGRLFRGREIPVVPILLNTYFPPNVMRADRCHDVGRALRTAIESIPDQLRIAVVASGGLSHFATDEALDRTVLDAFASGDSAPLRGLPAAALRSGSSEILNWVLTAGALEGVPFAWSEYLPVYRTPAGTGVGLGFACWKPKHTAD